MLKRKELIICIISVAVLLLAVTTNVFATTDLTALAGNVDNNSNKSNVQEITSTPANNNVPVNNNVPANNNIPANNNVPANNTTMPYTGVNYSVIVIIAICGVSAIYAYKKIRDYNV